MLTPLALWLRLFEAANPGIDVQVTYLDYVNDDNKFAVAIESGTAPDLIMEGPERLVTNWRQQGLMADLSDLLDRPTFLKSMEVPWLRAMVQTAACMSILWPVRSMSWPSTI